jgi:DNA-binding CsgD family transcriptional regulator
MSQTPTTARRLAQFTGFAFSITATLLLLKNLIAVQSPSLVFSSGILVVLLTASFLLIASLLNDSLNTTNGNKVLSCVKLLGCCIAPVGFMLLDSNALFLPLLAAGITASILFWGRFLASLDHQYLYVVSSAAFIIAGFVTMFSLGLEKHVMIYMTAAFSFVSWVCDRLFSEPLFEHIFDINTALSRRRNAPGKGNRFTLLTIGFVSGVVVVILAHYDFGFGALTLVGGGIVVLAGLVVLLAGRKYQRVFEDTARRTMGFCTALALLPLPFVTPTVQLVCIGVLLLSNMVGLIILISAMAETVCKRQISALWLFGFEGSIYMFGFLVGASSFWFALFAATPDNAFAAACMLAVIFAIIMQVFIENQTYPFFDSATQLQAADAEAHFVDESRLSAKGGAIWREKLDMVARNFDLSPRQSEVMEMLVKGRDAKYIMDHFVVSRSTAKTHTYNLYKKLGVHSRQELLNLVEQTDTPHASKTRHISASSNARGHEK